MNKTDIIIISMFLVVHIELIYERYRYKFKKFKKAKKEDFLKSLVIKQKEDELIVEKDKDIATLDEYVNFIKSILENYALSRNKKISLRTRQEILIKTIEVIPIASRHITLSYYYNLDDKEWYKLTDRDMMMLLETAYNDYTHDNLDSLNSIFTAALRLRDDKR